MEFYAIFPTCLCGWLVSCLKSFYIGFTPVISPQRYIGVTPGISPQRLRHESHFITGLEIGDVGTDDK